MQWNWQQPDWPQFHYNKIALEALEAQFLRHSGVMIGTLKHINDTDKDILTIDLMTSEALKTSEIEGEYLDRDSLQASIRRQFDLDTDNRRVPPAEQGIAEMMIDLYRNFAEPLKQETLFKWHALLTSGRRDLKNVGAYRTHTDPMQVISGPVHHPKIHFEAPPSIEVTREMEAFIEWFNQSSAGGGQPLPILTCAGIAHLYFVSIHPFEDGNGRIGRAIAEKVLSQGLGQATLNTLSETIQNKKKAYYDALEHQNKSNEITDWLLYFAQTILDAQAYTQTMINFLIEKTKLYDKFRGQFNPRQEKVIGRLFHEGPNGFRGGLSAENYISITRTSPATATRDLQDLVQKGVLKRTGERKGTRYHLLLNVSE